ncbi:ER membrane protein complex subunit 6 isoform X5 [Mauremys reevesii]|uniref:ER membrane protein complex subunit 6 isoform X5 n=1 Tax=Mauremys reevesii TaxID=260615 RepID=UPI00193EE269|nr:ER membrane protein complex subunit 6 isoform X5 [Mauremys reevesii]
MSLGRPRPGRAGKLQLGSRLLDQSFIICVLVAFYLRANHSLPPLNCVKQLSVRAKLSVQAKVDVQMATEIVCTEEVNIVWWQCNMGPTLCLWSIQVFEGSVHIHQLTASLRSFIKGDSAESDTPRTV